MKKIIAACALFISAQIASAEDVSIDNVYIPQAPPASMAYAAYLTITNNSAESRSVIGVSSPSFGMVHIHHTMMKDEMTSMKSIDELMVEPGQTITLEPGGTHIMLMKPKTEAMTSGMVPLTLIFKNGEKIEAMASVRAIN